MTVVYVQFMVLHEDRTYAAYSTDVRITYFNYFNL